MTKDAGINHFVWDVRHQNGVGAPPASYQARLTVDGQTFAQPFSTSAVPFATSSSAATPRGSVDLSAT